MSLFDMIGLNTFPGVFPKNAFAFHRPPRLPLQNGEQVLFPSVGCRLGEVDIIDDAACSFTSTGLMSPRAPCPMGPHGP